jgi:hypothetical protein
MFEKTIKEIHNSWEYELNKEALIKKRLIEGLPSSIGKEVISILSKDTRGKDLVDIFVKHLAETEQKGKIGLEKIEERIDANMYNQITQQVSSIPIYSENNYKKEGQIVSECTFEKLIKLANTYNYATEMEFLKEEIQPAI